MSIPFITHTRATVATRVNKAGLLETVGANFPVSNFKNGVLLGYYSQRAATNLLRRSEEFDNAVWVNSITGTGINPVRTANVAIAPDGTQTADRVFFDQGAGVGSDFSFIRSSEVSVTVQSYTGSIWLKADTVDDIGKQLLIRHAGGAQYGVFTLTADWQRVNRTESVGTIATRRFEIGVRTGSGGNAPQVSALLWGAQLEVGSEATSYIKTVDTTVTRNKDVATLLDPVGIVQNNTGAIGSTFDAGSGYPLIVNGLQHQCTGVTTWLFEYSPSLITLTVNGVVVDSREGTFNFSTLDQGVLEYGHFKENGQPNFEQKDLIIG
jgi:hypothetical protein